MSAGLQRSPLVDSARRRLLRLSLFGSVLLGCGVGCTPSRPQFKTVDITGIDYARQLSLTDEHGKPRQLSDFLGQVVVVFFGYTSCPDVCPTTLPIFASVRKALGADGARLQVLFVTLDPERDTQAVLARYLANFDPSFIGLRGTPAQTAAVAKEFKVFYEKVDGPTEDSYTIDHTAASVVLDAAGHPRLYVADSTPPADMVHDFKILLDQKV